MSGFTSITFEREEFRLLIKNIPAHICPICGEAVVDEDVAIRLLSEAENVSRQGIYEGVRDY